MGTNEYKNMTAKCVDKKNTDAVVLHEVSFDRKDSDGNWSSHAVRVMATDPMDAIKKVRAV